jgi:phosphomannomutase
MNRRRLFGTSGIRGIVNEELSSDFCRTVALAIASTLPQSSTVCIATDTRVSRDIIKDAVTSGLISGGVNVVDLGILPTPALALLTRESGFDAGIMVTASHNPPEFNGIKLFTENSLGYSQTQETEIESVYFDQRFRQGKRGTLEQGRDMKERYLSFIKGKLSLTGFKRETGVGGGCDDGGRLREGRVSLTGFEQETGGAGRCDDGGGFREGKASLAESKRETGVGGGGGDGGRLREGKVSLTGSNQQPGAGGGPDDSDTSRAGRLARTGSNHRLKIVVDPGNGAASKFASDIFVQMGFDVLALNDEPDGLFPGRSPEPKEDTLQGTVDFLRQHNADLAICFDGDADRVVFCDKEGFLGFNEPIAFISRLAVKRTGKKKVATTVETGTLLDLAVKDLGAEVVRGRVGDVPVAHLAQQLDAALGVEQVGVYIMPEVGYYPDSIFASLFLLSQLRDVGEIRQFFQGVPRLFFEKAKVSCPNEFKEPVMARMKEQADIFSPEEINALDGLRLQFADSWMLIRPSGTEPVIRVISESMSQKQTGELIGKGKGLVRSLVEASG